MSDKIQRKLRAQLYTDDEPVIPPRHAGGDNRYRIPLIGVNPGAIPGTRPDQAAELDADR